MKTRSQPGAGRPPDGERSVDELAALLARSQLLAGVSADAYAAIGGELGSRNIDAGAELVTPGDAAGEVYVVMSGELEVAIEAADGTQPLMRLGDGDVVGEIGVLAGDVRSATVRAVTACELISVSADGLRRLIAEDPARGESLASKARERLHQTYLVEHFNRLFGIFDEDVLATIKDLMEWVSLPAGHQLFAQDEWGDSAYLVATGRLGVFRRHPTSGAEVEVGQVGRGDIVGELSLIDGDPRSASVYAVRDTQLIKLTRAAYDELLDRYPRAGLAIAKLALGRQPTGAAEAADTARHGDRRRSFVLVPITRGVDLDAFAERLIAALGAEAGGSGSPARTVSSTDIDRHLGPGAAQIGDDTVGALRLAYVLEELEERHSSLVYLPDETWTPWSCRALRSTDQVVLVADAIADPTPSTYENELWSLLARQHHPGVSLVLLHPDDTVLPQGTPAWLEPRGLASHHHVRRGEDRHMARLARLLAGRGTSLVLSGGGARGFAHLGVLNVLDGLDVPVDMVSGTSIGSVMAIGPALEWSVEHSQERAAEAFRKLMDYTLPITSVLRGARITSRLHEIVGDVDISDLWVPYFCVAANLTTAAAEYLDRGDLVHAVRASIAIPGVLPPVPHNGDLLVDGGIIDNVPVAEMRRRNPTGAIIAVDVSPTDGPITRNDYGLSLSGLASIRARRRGGGPPNLMSTMVRSSLVGSVGTRRRIVSDGVADLFLEVEVEGGGLLDFSAGEQILESAASGTRAAITDWVEMYYRPTSDGEPMLETTEPRFVRTEPAKPAPPDGDTRQRRRGVPLIRRRRATS